MHPNQLLEYWLCIASCAGHRSGNTHRTKLRIPQNSISVYVLLYPKVFTNNRCGRRSYYVGIRAC